MGALYFGVGKAVGGLLGGLCIDWVGERNTFRYITFNLLNKFIWSNLFNWFNQFSWSNPFNCSNPFNRSNPFDRSNQFNWSNQLNS